jgi:hypothetical protein
VSADPKRRPQVLGSLPNLAEILAHAAARAGPRTASRTRETRRPRTRQTRRPTVNKVPDNTPTIGSTTRTWIGGTLPRYAKFAYPELGVPRLRKSRPLTCGEL